MLNFYLMFNGNAKEAIDTYLKIFEGKLLFVQKYSDMPTDSNFQAGDEMADKILHASIEIAGSTIMCSDGLKEEGKCNNTYISLSADAAIVQKAWDALKQGGRVRYELSPTFFAKLHGSLEDKFGINWMFTAE